MSKGYWISVYEKIEDPKILSEYAKKATIAIEKHNGRYLARGGKQKILEGLELERAVIVEFPSMAKALECYNSKEYAEAKSHREGAAEFHGVIVEGI